MQVPSQRCAPPVLMSGPLHRFLVRRDHTRPGLAKPESIGVDTPAPVPSAKWPHRDVIRDVVRAARAGREQAHDGAGRVRQASLNVTTVAVPHFCMCRNPTSASLRT